MLIEQYIFITIFLSAFVFFIIIHIAYPFWVHMSVSHIYDLHHRLMGDNMTVLQKQPYRNKWVSQQLKTISYHDLCDDIKDSVIDQLNCNYIPSDSILFTIEKKHLDTIFSGHFDTPYVTPFVQTIVKNKPLGCICSYPVRILYRQERKSANNLVFLACDRENPINKEITRKLIATHEYNCRNRVTDIKLSLLKKHIGKCEGIKPLLEFSTTLYYVQPNISSVKQTTIIQVYRENWSLINDIVELFPLLYDFCAYIDVGALKARVEAGQLWIFCLKYKGNILAVYFIEDAMMLYENVNDYGGKTMNLMGSICNMKKGNATFVRGFSDCLELIQKQNRDYTMLLIDDIGHNKYLTKGKMRGEIVKTSGAYYLLNGLVREKIESDRAIMLI